MAFDITAADTIYGALIAHFNVETVTIDGTDYSCNRASLAAQQLEGRDAEFVEAYKLTLILQASDLTAPDSGDTVTFNGTVYRILDKTLSPDEIELRLHLGDRFHE